MKRISKLISLVLSLAILLSMTVFPASAAEPVALQDPSFEGNIWSDGIWSYWLPDGESWSGKTVENFSYSSDSWMTPATNGGSQCIKFYLSSAGSFYFTQELSNVSAGTYTLSVDSMGAAGETVYVKMGDMLGDVVQTDSGYDNWTTSSGTFTITEDCATLIVGVQVTCSAGGWGYFDNLTLTKTDDGSGGSNNDQQFAELALENGDFEAGSSENWLLSGYSEVATDQWATNNGTNALSLWLSDSEAASGSASYTVKLTAGSYRFSYDISGAAMDSGLGYAITSGGTELAKGDSTTTTNGWDVWQTVTTADFTLAETTEVTFTLSGTQPAGYFGDLDNLKLYGTGSIAPDYSELTLENADFELGNANNWTLTGYSSVATNQWASNNDTNTLDLWLSDTEATNGAASYSVALTAGTYYFTFDLSGHTVDSGLSYIVTAGETELVKGNNTYTTGGWDVWQTETTESFTLTEETTVTFTLSGDPQVAGYWGNLDNLKLYGTGALAEKTPDPVEADIYVPYIKGTSGDFMRGMDISSLLSELNSGVKYYDDDGNVLDGQGFMNYLAACGTNWVRIRVWNDPFDSNGNGYGGGNCDIEAAKIMGKWATEAGLKVFIDFHYSDFWADPGKQQAPKAWANYTVDEKAAAIEEYTKNSLTMLKNAGVNVGMVQIGNETTNSICGVSNWADRCKLFSAGSKAVREIFPDALVAIHFTNPERSGNYANFARQLNTYNVDYDIFASSYYSYWHGTLENLTSVLKNVADTYGKQVIVAETSWAYTLDDGDGHDNTVRKNNNESDAYPFSVQGQATQLSDVVQAVKNVGEAGIGVFYWEPAWIPVQVYDGTETTLNENKALWEQYGSGWASSYAGEYDPSDAGVWYGGSSWDNQALFAFDGTPLESLKTYLYMQTGTSGFDIYVTSIEEVSQNYTVGDALSLPETLTVKYSFGSDQILAVVWDAASVAAVDMSTPGTYTVTGLVDGQHEATATINVKPENLLTNPSFESSDMSMYSSSQTYAKRTTDDPYAGSYSLHFYNSGVVNFTTSQSVTLEPGHYEFSMYGQGGNVGDDAVTYIYVTVGDTTTTENFALTGWAIWANPTICFDVTEKTTVTVGVNVTASQSGGWGTFDDWYLCANTDPTHSFAPATCTDVSTCFCGATDGDKNPDNHASLTHVDADPPTCSKAGNLEYWHCTDCGSFFLNEACTESTSANDVVVPRHSIIHYEEVPATCHGRGVKEHWFCEDCIICYTDSTCTTVIEESDLYIDALGSENIVHHEHNAPTCFEDGNIEYWYCEDCDGYFTDEACTRITNAMSVKLAPSHTAVHYEEEPATCHGRGVKEHWYCEACSTCYTDSDCTVVIEEADLYIDELGSENIIHHCYHAATCFIEGHIEYWYCEDCNSYFADEACTRITNAMSVKLAPIHTIVHVDAKTPTCLEEGNVEHWYCSVCGYTWLDEDCTLVSNQLSVLLPVSHNIVHVDAKAPTCFEEGNVEHWYCVDCGYAWLDEDCTLVTNLKSVILPINHSIIHVEAKAPTATENGNIEHWYCEKCGYAWLDEYCHLNTNLLAVVLPAETGDNNVSLICAIVALLAVTGMAVVITTSKKRTF